MYNVLFPLYAAWLYTTCSYYDYTQNKELYAKTVDINKVKPIFYNVHVVLPASMGAILTLKPITTDCNSVGLEILHLLMHILVGETWFYLLHHMLRLKIFNKFHKKHPEIPNTVGLLALYARPLDTIVVNMGSMYALHAMFGISALQLFIVGSYAIIHMVLHGTASKSPYQLHHLRLKAMHGAHLFMDKFIKTRAIRADSE